MLYLASNWYDPMIRYLTFTGICDVVNIYIYIYINTNFSNKSKVLLSSAVIGDCVLINWKTIQGPLYVKRIYIYNKYQQMIKCLLNMYDLLANLVSD